MEEFRRCTNPTALIVKLLLAVGSLMLGFVLLFDPTRTNSTASNGMAFLMIGSGFIISTVTDFED